MKPVTLISEMYLGKYQTLDLLGEGGMGKVFLARKLDDGQWVVIKVMHDHISNNRRFRQAFQREMVLMTRFRHPYAVNLFDASLEEGAKPCIVMEFVNGVTLGQMVEEQTRLDPYRFGHLLGQICQVLQAAHENGIIHRDLTPVNVMVTDPNTDQESIKVMDFGLARIGVGPYIPLEKLLGDENNIGGGTPDYVPPEQIRGETVDHRGDIYALGVLMYKVLTGFLPFETATTTEEILRSHVELNPGRFSELGLRNLVPPKIESLVLTCLEKNPGARPQSAMDLAYRYEEALGQKIIHGEPIGAEMLPAPAKLNRIDPRTVMDYVEAWMPEPIAVMKLKGFADDMGGEVLESEPGLIRFRFPEPMAQPQPKTPAGSGIFSLLSLVRKPELVPFEYVELELRLEKKESHRQNLLALTVMMKPEGHPEKLDNPGWRFWCQRICRQLRGYLISC